MKKWLFLLVLGLVFYAGWYAYTVFLTKSIKTVQVQRKEVTEVLVATGKFTSHRNSNLGFEVSGVLAELLVIEGDVVKKDQVLARLNHQDIDAQVAQAQSNVLVASREYDRIKRQTLPEDIEKLKAGVDAAKASVKQAELDLKRAEQLGEFGNDVDRDLAATKLEQAKSSARQISADLSLALRMPLKEELALAEAQLNNAKANLEYTLVLAVRRELRAPYDGLIVTRFVDVGVSVPLGSPIVRLAETSAPEIWVDTDEANLGKLKLEQIAIVSANGYPGKSFKAVLKRIGPAIDSQRGVVPLLLIPQEVPDWIRPDMTVDISMETRLWSNTLTLPSTAVSEKDGIARVVVLENGLVHFKTITLLGKGKSGVALEGLADEEWVALYITGLEEGQKIRFKK